MADTLKLVSAGKSMRESQLEQLLAQHHTCKQDIVDVDEPVLKLVIFSLADYYFALPGTAIKEVLQRSSILLARGTDMHSGLRVDSLLDVVDIAVSQIQPAPDALPEYLQPYVSGLLEFNALAVAVLDIDTLFAAWQKGQG